MEEKTRHLIRVLRSGSQTAQDICAWLAVSRSALSRVMETCRNDYPGFLCQIGAARATRYAWAMPEANNPDHPWRIPVYEMGLSGEEQLFGTLTVLHGDEYLFAPTGDPDQRFPQGWLRAHYEGVPWFLQDARPQGYLGRALAQRLFLEHGNSDLRISDLPEHVHQWSDIQVLQVISEVGNDLPGCFVFGETALNRARQQETLVISSSDRSLEYARRVHEMISGHWIPHSSAGGEQPKFTACVRGNSDRQVIVKFSPEDGEETDRVAQRWRDLLLSEFHALSVLAQHGFPSAMPDLLQGSDSRWFLESPRFDRVGERGRVPAFSLHTVILESMGDLPSWWSSAERLCQNGVIDAESKEQIFLMDAYGHFIGNTDRHPGNLSFMLWQEPSDKFTLAPVYDMLPMQYAPDTQGSMVPSFKEITAYPANHDQIQTARDLALLFWSAITQDLRISPEFREMALSHAEALSESLEEEVLPNEAAEEVRSAARGSKEADGIARQSHETYARTDN